MVDCLGLVWKAVVTRASVQDQDGAILVLDECQGSMDRLVKILADSAYGKGRINTWLSTFSHWKVEIIKALEGQKGFEVQPWRWIVERTFAWFYKFRRLSKDYEFLTETSQSLIYAAMTRLTLARLARIK